MTSRSKVYVRVDVCFTLEGDMEPRAITWTDGRKFNVDRFLGVKHASTMSNPTDGDRYTVSVDISI